MAGRRGSSNAEFFEEITSDQSFVVVHEACQRPVLVLEIWGARISGGESVIRVEGICKYCDRYVRLQYRNKTMRVMADPEHSASRK